jgi:hypothetical protein
MASPRPGRRPHAVVLSAFCGIVLGLVAIDVLLWSIGKPPELPILLAQGITLVGVALALTAEVRQPGRCARS